MKHFTKRKDFLVEKTAVHADDDRDIATIFESDFKNHVADHIRYRITVIGMFVPAAKDRIDDEAPPIHLQGLKALFLLVGGFNTVATFCVVVVQHHRIDTQLDYIGLSDPQTPNEKGLQKAPEQKHAGPGKRFEKTFDLIGRSHVFFWRLDATGIAFIARNLVEVSQPTTGAIDKKAEHLFEKLCDCKAFSVLSDGAEPPIQPAKNLDAVHIGHEQGQARPSGQAVGSDFDTSDFEFILLAVFAMFAHRVLHLLGVCNLVVSLGAFNKYYSTLTNF